jgi:hypothetical protein
MPSYKYENCSSTSSESLIFQLSFDALIFYSFGLKAIVYLLFGTLIAMGLHPSAGHFISEHYIFTAQQETYSYYGAWNLVTFNVGKDKAMLYRMACELLSTRLPC